MGISQNTPKLHTQVDVEKMLREQYAIAFAVGAASRDAEIGMLITYLEYISSGELGPKICAALAKDALAKVRKP